MSSVNDAIALSIMFFEDVKGFKKDGQGKIKTANHYKYTVMKDIQDLLAGNMNFQTLQEAIVRYVKSNPANLRETYIVSDILQALRIPHTKGVQQVIPDNLVNPSHFYYHPELQLTPPPPVIVQLPNGDFQSTYEDFYLEVKEAFTLDDLVKYFYDKVGVADRTITLDRDKGAFKHMLKSWDVDFVLYMIDEMCAQAMNNGYEIPKEPFTVQDHIEQAKLTYESRKNICFEGGFDRVIPRNRH